MGLPNLMALTKFYGVMTTALALTNNQLPYYKLSCFRPGVKLPRRAITPSGKL